MGHTLLSRSAAWERSDSAAQGLLGAQNPLTVETGKRTALEPGRDETSSLERRERR